MYTFNRDKLEENIKYIEPGALFTSVGKKISAKVAKDRELQESELAKKAKEAEKADKKYKKVIEESYGNSLNFMKNIYSKIEKSKKVQEKKKHLITESYNPNIFEEKAMKDLVFMKELFETSLKDIEGVSEETQERFKKELFEMTKTLLNNVVNLYQETNTKPRYITPTLAQKHIEEAKIIETYKRNFNKFLTENYILPLRKGEVKDDKIKKFVKVLTENGVDVNLEELIAYVPFEESVKTFLQHILIPEPAEFKIKAFVESQDDVYFEYFDNNAKVLMESIEEQVAKIASLLSPFLFKDKIEDGGEFNPMKLAGTSIICKQVNDGPMECSVNKEEGTEDIDKEIPSEEEIERDAEKDAEDLDLSADEIEDEIEDDFDADLEDKVEKELDKTFDKDDKDYDGKKDSEEDHGELPEDFEDDHKDAEKLKDKDLKESTEIQENEAEPGVDKTIKTDNKKFEKETEKEEIIPDESSDHKSIDKDDGWKEEKW